MYFCCFQDTEHPESRVWMFMMLRYVLAACFIYSISAASLSLDAKDNNRSEYMSSQNSPPSGFNHYAANLANLANTK